MSTNYNSIDLQPLYGQAQYNSSSGYITPMPPRKRSSNWVRIAIPILLIVIVGAVVGGIIGSHKKHNSSATSSAAAASSAASAKTALGRFATATDSEFLVPIYVSTVRFSIFFDLFGSHNARYRLIPPCLLPPPSSRPITLLLRGHKIPSNQPNLNQLLFDQIDPALSPLLINGLPFRSSFRMTLTSKAGTPLFSAMLQIIILNLPSSTSWMAQAAS
jgi:hypothetical protein